MVGLGGAIGVGLFLGSSVTTQLAGPGVTVRHGLGAATTVVVAYARAEMPIVHPVAGRFRVCAECCLSPSRALHRLKGLFAALWHGGGRNVFPVARSADHSLRFSQCIRTEPGSTAPLAIEAAPLPTLLGLVFFLGIAGSTFLVRGFEYTVPTFVVFFAAITLAYCFREKSGEPAVMENRVR
jgi:L-asparagine transporter-like permease